MLTLCVFPIITPRPSLQSYTMHAGGEEAPIGEKKKNPTWISTFIFYLRVCVCVSVCLVCGLERDFLFGECVLFNTLAALPCKLPCGPTSSAAPCAPRATTPPSSSPSASAVATPSARAASPS